MQLPMDADPIDLAEIAFGEWLPDQPDHNNPGALEALNVLPVDGCYAPFPQLVLENGNPLLDRVRGAASVISDVDVVQIFAGTIGGMFSRLGAGDWAGLVTGAFNENYAWQFIRSNEQMVCLHQDYPPWRVEVGNLVPLTLVGGTPPTAACGAQVGDFLMLGNLRVDPDDGGDAFPARVRWGGFNNIDSPWITDPATQADFQDMPAEGGSVIAISGREQGIIFQQRMISRAVYRGPPNIFDISVAEDKRGCIARDSVVDVGQVKFFIAEDGFFIWNGTNSVPIGDARVNRYFFSRLQYSRRSRIVGAADFENGCVMWAFPTSTSGLLDEIIIYSYRDNKFTHSIQSLEYLFNSALSNLTVEELTEAAESYDISFDSDFYTSGGRSRMAAFNDSHAYGLYEGLPMEATIDTGEYSGPGGRRVFVNNARPLVDLLLPSAFVQALTRDQMLGQPIQYGPATPQEYNGQCPILADGRYIRIRTTIPAGAVWTHGTGVEVNRKASGVF